MDQPNYEARCGCNNYGSQCPWHFEAKIPPLDYWCYNCEATGEFWNISNWKKCPICQGRGVAAVPWGELMERA